MSNNSNLDDVAPGVIADALYGMDTLDMDALRDAVPEFVASAAENSCMYTSVCMDIISRYESDPRAANAEDMCSEATYTAADWTIAMTAYAGAIAHSVIEADVQEALTHVDTAATLLLAAAAAMSVAGHGNFDDFDEPRVSCDCPHGWAVHAKEDADGVHYWNPAELEGCAAVAVRVAGIWLSYTWTPGAVGEA